MLMVHLILNGPNIYIGFIFLGSCGTAADMLLVSSPASSSANYFHSDICGVLSSQHSEYQSPLQIHEL